MLKEVVVVEVAVTESDDIATPMSESAARQVTFFHNYQQFYAEWGTDINGAFRTINHTKPGISINFHLY